MGADADVFTVDVGKNFMPGAVPFLICVARLSRLFSLSTETVDFGGSLLLYCQPGTVPFFNWVLNRSFTFSVWAFSIYPVDRAVNINTIIFVYCIFIF